MIGAYLKASIFATCSSTIQTLERSIQSWRGGGVVDIISGIEQCQNKTVFMHIVHLCNREGDCTRAREREKVANSSKTSKVNKARSSRIGDREYHYDQELQSLIVQYIITCGNTVFLSRE